MTNMSNDTTDAQIISLGSQYKACIHIWNDDGVNRYVTLVDANMSNLSYQAQYVILCHCIDNPHTHNSVLINGTQVHPGLDSYIDVDLITGILMNTQEQDV